MIHLALVIIALVVIGYFAVALLGGVITAFSEGGKGCGCLAIIVAAVIVVVVLAIAL